MGWAELQPEDIDETITALQGAFKRTLYAFCNATSIHGLKYTKDKETNKYIRFIWILITLIMFMCAIVMVVTFYMEYRSNPTRMNVESDHAPVSSLIFPPTIICPEIMFNMQKSKAFLETLILPNFTQVNDILDMFYINYGFMYDIIKSFKSEAHLLDEVLLLNNLSILDFIEKISWDCRDLMFRCRFQNEIVHCNKLFRITNTFRGHCCSFNLNQANNSRYAHAGLYNGLSLILYYNGSMIDLMHSYSNGFKILIQETKAFPSADSVIKFIPLNEEVFITIRPTQTISSQAVKDLSIENRLCILPNENILKFFDSNSGSNCKINCNAEHMLKMCNCYTYFYHSDRINDRVCSFNDIPCLVNNYADIIGRFKKTQCTCFRPCERMEYAVQVSNVPLQLDIPTIDKFYDGIKKDYSVVHIYMNSQVYRRLRQDLLSNMVTLVSNLGSAFSLFVGMSMISVVEIVYYFSIVLNKLYQQECRAREILLRQKMQNEELEKNKQQEQLGAENEINVEDI